MLMLDTVPQKPKPYGVIYTVTNRVNGKQYVGQTTQPVRERWVAHVRHASSGSNGYRALWNAIRKYGPDAFDVESVIACDNQEELDRMEALAIEAGGTLSPGGYNLKTGGGNGRFSAETRAKLSASRKGRSLSPDARAKVSAAKQGKPLSPEHRAKISAARKGKQNPGLAERNRNSRGKPSWRRGKHLSPEHRAKMSLVNRGHPVFLETRAKISAAQKGRILSQEHRAKLTEARRNRKK